jgi:CHAD domain-containing protein
MPEKFWTEEDALREIERVRVQYGLGATFGLADVLRQGSFDDLIVLRVLRVQRESGSTETIALFETMNDVGDRHALTDWLEHFFDETTIEAIKSAEARNGRLWLRFTGGEISVQVATERAYKSTRAYRNARLWELHRLRERGVVPSPPDRSRKRPPK